LIADPGRAPSTEAVPGGGTDEQHPKPGRLARDVRPEEGVDLAPAHPRVEIVDATIWSP
jgi:hypothetical protein